MARRGKTQAAAKLTKHLGPNDRLNQGAFKKEQYVIAEEHLPPLPLVFTILMCSGALLVLALRDVMATGRNIGGSWDEAMMVRLALALFD